MLTRRARGSLAFDSRQPFRVQRTRLPVLLPSPRLARAIDTVASELDAGMVVLDPALPLGLVGPSLGRPYAVVVHGAELVVPARLPGAASALRRVLGGASVVIAAGGYPLANARAVLGPGARAVSVPPGVDTDRFRPLTGSERTAAREQIGLPAGARVVLSVSRLVRRKGMDVLVAAAALLSAARPDLVVAVAGDGPDRRRLGRRIDRLGAPVVLLGRVPDHDLPPLYGCADVFAMLCRSRWAGLEEEGFGVVFLEAAASGVPGVAGDSGGASEAVDDGTTGTVVRDPGDPAAAATAMVPLLDDAELRTRMGEAARRRAVCWFGYDRLAGELAAALQPPSR